MKTRVYAILVSLVFAVVTGLVNAEPAPSERLAPDLNKLVKKIDKKDSTEAQVLLRKTLISIDDQGLGKVVSYIAVHINSDEAARDYSQISVSFNSFYEDIHLDFANVRTSDGKRHKVQADATQIQSPVDENFYHDQKELLFSLPNVRKGSVIEFQYTYIETKKIMPGAWFDSFGFHWWEGRAAGQGARADKVLQSELDIITPSGKPLYFNDASQYGVKFKQSSKNNLLTYSWRAEKLPEVKLQEYMQRDHAYAAYVRAGTVKDWQPVAQWADSLISPHIKMDARMNALADEIRKTAKTPDEKVKAVYSAMQDKIRYVFAHVGRGGYEPHDAPDVLKNGYGDCKDQTVFAVTLLRSLGIEANPVLIATRSRGIPDMTIPAVTFDHMIVQIPKQKGLDELWMDTTGDASLYPGFSVSIEDQPALVVNATTGKIVTLPSLPAQEHSVDFTLEFTPGKDKNVTANFTIVFSGMYEQRLRSMWQYTPDREKYFREFMKNMYTSAELTELKASNADSLWKGFQLEGKFLFTNVWEGKQSPLEYGFSITQLTNIFADLRSLDKPENRKQRFVINPGYSINSRIIFNRPVDNYHPDVKTQGQNLENKFFALKQSGHDLKTGYEIRQQLVMNPIDLSLDEYADYYQAIESLNETPDWNVSYVYDSSKAELAAAKKTGKSALEQDLAVIRLYLKKGQYAESLKLAEDRVIESPNSGEAWYLLGLAQGYNELLDESDKSFRKAESLGYSL